MEGDQTSDTLDRLSQEAQKREQQQKAAERWNTRATSDAFSHRRGKGVDQNPKATDQSPGAKEQGIADSGTARDGKLRDAAGQRKTMLPATGTDATWQTLDQLIKEVDAQKAEMRQSILDAVERLPEKQRPFLQNPDAALKINVPHGWSHRFQDLQDILDSIPEIKASYRCITFKEEIGGRSNRIGGLEVFGPKGFTTVLQGEKAPTETVEAKAAADRRVSTPGDELADRVEMRESILAAIRGLPKEQRAMLLNPDAGFGVTLPSSWSHKFEAFLDILDSIPEIKAKYRAFEYKEGVGRDSNRMIHCKVYERPESREQGSETRRPPAETGEAKAASDQTERLSAEERAERRRIANPDNGVGCPFGGVPDGKLIRDTLEKRLGENIRARLKNPNDTVYVHAFVSDVGAADANSLLARRRGNAVADVLRSMPGVEAKIEVICHGSEVSFGKRGHDYCVDRIVMLGATDSDPRGTKTSSFQQEQSMYDRLESQARGLKDIPPEYAKGYVLTPIEGSKDLYQRRSEFVRGLATTSGERRDPAQAERHAADLDRYVKEMQAIATTQPHRALWGIKPWEGFVADLLDDRGMREPIRHVLEAAGYDGDVMLRKWMVHWICKGAR